MNQQQLILVTGAARSGKSEWAETLALGSNKTVTYVATATIDPNDPEWQARISRHQQRRPVTWTTICAVEDLYGKQAILELYRVKSKLALRCILHVSNDNDRIAYRWGQ